MSEIPAELFERAHGWRVEDLLNLPPGAPEHLELLSGVLVLRSPQRLWHTRVIDALVAALRPQVPRDLDVVREMNVVCGPRLAPEPDVCIVEWPGQPDLDVTLLDAAGVRLVIEVVSPDSVIRDRQRKPQIYAAAGIEHYWIVDRDGRTTVVQVHELDPACRAYGPATVFHDRVEVVRPFPVRVDLSEARLISGRRGA